MCALARLAGRLDLVTARERVRVACKLAGFPAIDDALRRGEVSYSKVRALVRVATPANETLLLDHARLMTASQLEKLSRKYALVQRHCQDPHPLGDEQRRYVHRRDTDDGMVKIEAVLHPEEAELVWTMLNHAGTQLARDAARPADEVSAPYIEAWRSDDSAGSREFRPTPATAATSSPEPVQTCGADDSAESQAIAPAPGTRVASSPESASLCTCDDSAESRVAVHAPADANGRVVAVVPSRLPVAELGWSRIRAANESQAIDANTIACEWDGTPVDYGAVIGHLVVADGLR